MSALIGALRVTLGMDSAAFERGSRQAQREATGMRDNMTKAAGAIGAAFAGMLTWETVKMLRDMTAAAVDAAGGLGEQAAALGVTTDALQEYRYAATQVGLSSDEMDKSFEQLTRRMGDAALAGKGPIVDAFNALGITLDELKGKSAGDVIPMIADGMAKIEDPAVRASLAVDLFGKSGQRLATLLAGGSDEVNSLRQAAHDLGIVLSESDIAKADEVADKVAALQYVLTAQQNAKLLENADALLAYEEAVGELKMGLIDASGTLQTWADEFDAFAARNMDAMKPWRDANELTLDEIKAAWASAKSFIVDTVGGLVGGVTNWLGAQLDKVWKRVADKIAIVKAAFFGLYDAVIGHSYIPDMVDGIAAEMARLDGVMVKPVAAATSKAQEAFRDMLTNVRGLMDRLFPEVREAMDFAADDALIGQLPAAMQDEARRRQWSEMVTGNPLGTSGRPNLDLSGDAIDQHADDALDRFNRRMLDVTKTAEDARVRVSKSFREMAEDTLGSLNRLTSAVKNGGFLGILEALIGVGMQLGSIGAFGKTIQNNLNRSVPSYAGGTNFHPGGMALVGERGPELVSMPRGSRVYSNDNSRGMMGGVTNNYFNGNLMTEEFWARINAGDMGAARAGSAGAIASATFQRSRSLG